MKNIILLGIIFISVSCTSNNDKLPQNIQKEYDKASLIIDECHELLSSYQDDKNLENYLKLYYKLPDISFKFSKDELSDTQYYRCKRKQLSVDSIKRVINRTIKKDLRIYEIVLLEEKDKLIRPPFTLPFYAHRGENIKLSADSQDNFTFKIYNADSKKQFYKSNPTTNIDTSFDIQNSAVYLIEISGPSSMYIDFKLNRKPSSVEDLLNRKKISIDTIASTKNEFRAQKVKGVSIRKVFEEPRKITLRSQGKALFSGSTRSIIALNLPTNCSDVMYSLRISTSDSDKQTDGQFFDKTYKRYHEIRFLGLPLYESTRTGNSLLRELLSASEPFREEEAYCNLYVFKSAAEARKFQNEADIKTIKYNLDYSIVGTQSCNGRVPAKGLRTLYLGFENPKITSSVYLWLEALSTVETTEYFKEKYVLN